MSGATYSSRSVLQNVAAAAEYAASHQVTAPHVWTEVWQRPEVWAALAVALMGAIIPLFTTSRRYRIVQLVLNVAVLGCWTGFCLSYGLLLGWMAGGVEWAAGLVPMVLLLVALLYPLLGRQGTTAHGSARWALCRRCAAWRHTATSAPAAAHCAC